MPLCPTPYSHRTSLGLHNSASFLLLSAFKRSGFPDAAVSAGASRTPFIFITTDGREWDASVIEVIENPVGLWEAFKLPFKRLSALVGGFAEKFSGGRMKDLEKKATAQMAGVEKSLTAPAPKPGAKAAPAAGVGIGGLLMGGGVAFAAMGSALAYAMSKLREAWPGPVLAVVGGLFVVITAPTIISAIIKLRRRNLSALLEACGWSVNAKIAVKRHSDFWVVEMAIPLASLPGGRTERYWGVNFTRFATQGCEASSWAEAPRYFYDPRNMGTMFMPEMTDK